MLSSNRSRPAASAPPGVTVSQVYNIGQFIESSVEGVVDALGLAIVLVLLILFLFAELEGHGGAQPGHSHSPGHLRLHQGVWFLH